MPLEFVIEKNQTTVSWRHPGKDQAIGLSTEEAQIVAAIDQAQALSQVADGLFAIAEAIREAGSNISMSSTD